MAARSLASEEGVDASTGQQEKGQHMEEEEEEKGNVTRKVERRYFGRTCAVTALKSSGDGWPTVAKAHETAVRLRGDQFRACLLACSATDLNTFGARCCDLANAHAMSARACALNSDGRPTTCQSHAM
jgi:hypothetical protein